MPDSQIVNDNKDMQQEIEAKLPGGASLKVRGSDILGVAIMVVVLLLAYVVWEHKMDSKDLSTQLTNAVKEMVQAVRESNCLQSLPQERRERDAEFCKRVTR